MYTYIHIHTYIYIHTYIQEKETGRKPRQDQPVTMPAAFMRLVAKHVSLLAKHVCLCVFVFVVCMNETNQSTCLPPL